MVNRGSDDANRQQWYPQLPDGYEGQQRHHGGPGFQPGPGRPPQHGGPGFQPGPGRPPQHGGPGFQPRPGRPPQHGGPGFQPGPGRPPQHGGPGFQPGPGRPPQHGGPGQQPGNQAPTSPPPNHTPEYPTHQTFAIDPGAIIGCMYRFTYIWLSRRQGFWFYPVFVGPRSVAGYRWNQRRKRWEYTGIDLNQINQFTCF